MLGIHSCSCLLALSVLLGPVPTASAQILPFEAANKSPKSNSRTWRNKVLSPSGYMQPVIGALVRHARNSPEEWERNWGGLGKRLGSATARHAIKNTIKYGVGSLLHEELHFRSSGKTGFGPRLRYALLSTVITRKTTTGNRTLAVGEISGVLGGALISRLWQPLRLKTVGSGFTTAGATLGSDAIYNVVREFWPEIRHPRRGKKLPVPAPTASIIKTQTTGPESVVDICH